MVPAADPQRADKRDAYYSANYSLANGDPERPFIATYKTGRDNNSIWQIEASGDGYYYLKHWLTGKYLIYEPPHSDKPNRKSVHLQKTNSPGDNAKFDIQGSGTGVSIRPISVTSGNRFLNPANNNFDRYYGSGGDYDCNGLVGIWSSNGDKSIWHLDEAVLPPSFSVSASGDITLTSAEGTTIYYTTDGTTPTTSSTEYTDAITPTAGMTAITAIAVSNSDSSKKSNAVSLALQSYTYYIINRSGNVAIKKEVTQSVGKLLTAVDDIPSAIRSSYLDGEAASFYTFSEAYTSPDQLTDEVKITATPAEDAKIYVTYTADHLSEKFLHLRGSRAFNIKIGDGYAYDNDGTIAYYSASDAAPLSQAAYLWNIGGNDPYDVQIKNLDTDHRYLVFSTPPTLSLAATATTKFILMAGSADGDGTTYEQVKLMAVTGTGSNDFSKEEIRAYPFNISTTYHLIDKAGKLIASIPSSAAELSVPDDWQSPLVSAYHYFRTASIDGSGVYTLSNTVTSPFDSNIVDGNIYVNYDVSDAIDLEGTKTYLMKFSDGESFNQENGSDGILDTPTKAIYPYNNGDFNLYVYGQAQWDNQLSSGASTRSRWLWYIKSRHDGVDLTGANVDPYHVVFKSYQNHTVKDKDLEVSTKDINYGTGSSYLQTYKPSDYASVVTNIAYENAAYYEAYPAMMPSSMVNGQPTEYMILGTSLQNMTLKTFYEVEGERRIVNSFEQYWKNNPTVEKLVGAKPASDNATLAAKDWHRFTSWAYSAPWGGGSKTLREDTHWYQTISMGSGQFTFEEVSLAPQVILLDQHGWEVMRVPMYADAALTVVNTEELSKFNSPMVAEYQWYPKAEKYTGYHKYRVSDPDIVIYELNEKNKWVDNGRRTTHNSTSLADVPYLHIDNPVQDKSVKTDFYVTYTVKPRYISTYTGAATADATQPSAYLLKQGGSYAQISGSNIVQGEAPASMDNVHENIKWYLRPNFDIDQEMGYRYAGESGAQTGAKTKDETEQDYYDDGKNGFDPYNVQVQSVYNQKRYFTADTSSPTLNGGTWTGTSTQVTLQNLNTKRTATGHDQTTLNITNATFMVVADANGNMRLMPRFDNSVVANSDGSGNPFASLAAQTTAATEGDQGTGVQTLWLELIPTAMEIHSSAEMTEMNGHYLLAEGFTFDSGFTSLGTSSAPFTGVIDGQYHTFSSPNTALVAYADGAVIRNLMLDDVDIDSGNENGNVGAICNEATGDTRIYNCGILATNSTVRIDNSGYTHISSCSSTVSGSNYVGGLVGLLDGSARVINCFSYANITGGATVGGIVGYNNVATTSSNLKTMVMNCMFYGDITGGTTSKAPIYNGKIITNRGDQSGVGNYNYFYGDASYVQPTGVNYNCALLAETRFLQRFEFFRHLLNSHRELAAWWATGDYSDKEEMAKWVLLPSQIGSSTPYPVLAKPGYYPSVVNIDADNAPAYTERNKGGNMGTLAVTIRMGDGAQFEHPTGAEIVYPSLTLNITDKDPDHFNFNYYKVQLPYYNDVGTKNYTGNRVVTGWKIVSITGGTPGTFSTSTADAPSFNFADRQCTNKDLYSTSDRVFNQGAYWDVPEGVTAITIEPYWAKAAYLADANADKVYNQAMGTGYDVPNVGGGTVYDNGSSYPIAGDSQVVYTASDNARNALGLNSSHTVYDYAIVLVGNFHNIGVTSGDANHPYTIMSADFDNDNEPDYSYILRFNGRTGTHPVRVDFLNIPGLGMAQKTTGGTGSYNFGIMQPKGWFETTNTSLFRVTQFEYDASGHGAAPYIVHGGVMEQWVSAQADNTPNKITYYHVGSNVWFKEFHRGVHQDNKASSKHPPISVTGGDFDEFYLTGLYRADITKYDDNAECYINGGRFGVVAGTGMEGIGNNSNGTGNITWQIQNADIKEFYGGGINADKIAEGNITTTITGGKIDLFCGGPKFGDMNPGKTVVTTATGCEFGSFFGAGYGGNSYSRRAPKNYSTSLVNMTNPTWNGWVAKEYTLSSATEFPGISTQFSYQFIPLSSNTTNVARLFVEHVQFSLATTHDVTSTLTDCVITGNFYGGGSLGKVAGPATSTLTNCDVRGNVYGAGYSAALPTVEVDSIGFRVEPYYYESLGTYRTGVKGATTTYQWQHGNAIGIDKTNHILYTTEDLTHLGTVTGNATLTINGTTTVAGSVYGGGEMSNVTGDTKVQLVGGTINNNVYGGGRGTLETDEDGNVTGGVAATVGGATVELNKDVAAEAKGCVVKGSIFGCNNLNGTPLGDVTVHIYATQNEAATRITNPAEGEQTAKVKGRYDLKAVYGGGNLAKYEPADLVNNKTQVIIDGCDSTSIEQVYGGGNAASTPATSVTVNGTYEIDEVFGGGNGKDDITINGKTKTNPGANVGFYDYSAVENNEAWDTKEERQTNEEFKSTYTYGTGEASVNIYGGTIHKVFGGSNTKGNVRISAVTMLNDNNECDFCVDEAYGGGKSAPMDATATLTMACIPGLKAAYGGAEAADMNGDVELNISNGTFNRVFGGNNISGTIRGAIKVNIEETGCRPIIIGELYGGGNLAGYSVKGYNDDGSIKEEGDNVYADPQVNLTSFTSIGNVFGGGYGEKAVMVGNPTVNINEEVGSPTEYPTTGDFDATGYKGKDWEIEDGYTVTMPAHTKTKIGAIGNVFGGGNAARVIGDATVNVGTVNNSANITGNVYGGGNNAEVTGDTNVNIGRKNP